MSIFNKYYFFLPFFFLSMLILYFFHHTGFTYPKDGVLYIYLSDQLYANNFNLNYLDRLEFNSKLHTNQIGVAFLLAFLKLIFSQYNLISFNFCVFILWALVYFYIKNIFSNLEKKNFIFIFLILVFLQIDNLKSLSSFYNEAIYYPLFIISFLIYISKFIYQKSKLVNKYLDNTILLFFFTFGIFFQIFHIIVCITLFINLFFVKKKFIVKEAKIIAIITILSLFSFFIFYEFNNYLFKNKIILLANIDLNNVNNPFSYIFQKFFNIFTSPVNIHIILVKLTVPQINMDGQFLRWGLIEYLLSIIFFLIFIFCFSKNFKNSVFDKITITLIVLSFITKLLIIDYDIRYNIYTNFFVSYYLSLEIINIKYKKFNFLKIFLLIIFLSLVIIKFNNYFYNKERPDRSTLKFLSYLKKNKNDILKNEFNFVLSDVNARIIYWILKKKTCYFYNYTKCISQDSNFIAIYNEKNINSLNSKKTYKIE